MSKKVTLKYSGLGPVSMPNAGGGVYTIKPGVNQKDADEFELMKKQPDFAAMLDRGKEKPDAYDKKTGVGNLSVVGSSESDSDDSDGSDERVPGNAKQAKALVAETEDTGLLRSWLEKEDRGTIKAAIEKKLADIDAEREAAGEKE